MKRKVFFSITIAVMVFHSCSKTSDMSNIHEISVPVEEVATNFEFSGIATLAEVVAVSDSCGLSNIDRLWTVGDKYLLWDKRQGKACLLDSSGRLITHVGRRGNASNEYAVITDMWVEGDEVCLYDNVKRRVSVYDEDGSMVRMVESCPWAMRFCTHEGSMYFCTYGQNDSETMLSMTDGNGKTISELMPYPTFRELPVMDNCCFAKGSSGEILFFNPMQDVIYRLDGDEAVPVLSFDFGADGLGCRGLTDPALPQRVNDRKYVGGLDDVYKVGECLLFSFRDNLGNRTLHAVCDERTGEVHVYDYSVRVSDLLPVSPQDRIVGADDGNVYFQIDTTFLPEKLKSKVLQSGVVCKDGRLHDLYIVRCSLE